MKNTMKTGVHYALIVALCFISSFAFAQGSYHPRGNNGTQDGNQGDKIESLRIAFITQRLNLSPQEAEKFWPVYNAFKKDMDALRSNFKIGQGNPPLTAEQQLDFEQKKLDLKKKYMSQYEAVLGKDKLNILYSSEREFRRKLKEIHDQRQEDHRAGAPQGGQRK